jgi:hypothetical protein
MKGPLFGFDFSIQAVTEAARNFIFNAVRHQPDHVPGPVQDSLAVRAGFEMSLHPRPQLRGDVAIDVIRDFPPNFQATYLNHAH